MLEELPMTFPSVSMKHDIFSKKNSHSYIVVLMMWYLNQGQVIMTTKTSYGNSHFEITKSKSVITYLCLPVHIVTDF